MGCTIEPYGADGDRAWQAVSAGVQPESGDEDETRVGVCTGRWFLTEGLPDGSHPVLVIDERGDEAVLTATTESQRARYVDPDSSTRQIRAILERAAQNTTRVRRQAAAMDASLTGISVLDEEGRYVYMNDAHAAIFDAEPAELVGGTWRQIYDEDRIERIESTVFPQVAADGVWEGEIVGRRLDGSPVPQRVHLTTLADGGLVCVNRDITDEQRHRDRLATIRERVETLMLADDREAVIGELVAAVGGITDRQFVGYWRYDGSRDALVPAQTSATAVELPTIPRGAGLLWDAFETGRQAYHPAVHTADGRYDPDTSFESAVITPVGNHGVLAVASRTAEDFTQDEQELVQITATHADTALRLIARNAQLRDARDQVVAERRQLRDVIDQLPQFVYATNADGRIVLANEAIAAAADTTVRSLEADGTASSCPIATAARDRRVIDTEEPTHTSNEHVETADGDRLTLDTWRVPFVPADRDETAVLTVSTDVTDHRRQQKLAALYRIGGLLLEADERDEVGTVAARATREALDATGVTVYQFDTAGRTLRSVGTAGAAGPQTVGPSDGKPWAAFGSRETVTDDSSGQIATPLGEFGLLVVTGVGDTSEAVQFVETAATTVSAALRTVRQEQRLRQLNDQLRTTNVQLRHNDRLAIGFREASGRLRQATTAEEVYELLVEFATLTGDEAWVSRWEAGERRLDPVAGGTEGGAITPQESPSPGVAAVRDDEATAVSNTARETEFETWAAHALTHGYQSTLSVPISHSGVARGTLDVAATTVGAFDTEARRYLTTLCRGAAAKLDRIEAHGDTVEVDLACVSDRVLLPEADELTVSIQQVAVHSETALSVEGTSKQDPTAYLTETPGFTEPTVVADGERYSFEVRIVAVPSRQIEPLLRVLSGHDAVIHAVESDPTEEVVTVRLPAGRSRELRRAFDDTVAECRLAGKRRVSHHSPTGLVAALTDRQREVIAAAYQLGYYDRPKRINGNELAERFDVSRSTVHQHLRTAERKLLGGVFGRSD